MSIRLPISVFLFDVPQMPSVTGDFAEQQNTGFSSEKSAFTLKICPLSDENACLLMPVLENSSKRAQIEAEEKFCIQFPFAEKPFIMLVLEEI